MSLCIVTDNDDEVDDDDMHVCVGGGGVGVIVIKQCSLKCRETHLIVY